MTVGDFTACHVVALREHWTRKAIGAAVAALPAELPVGEVGEIVTRSDCVMEDYWDNPEATAETLPRRLAAHR